MAIPLIAPAIIGGAASLLGGLFNSNSQKNANEQQQKFASDMYERQKADNLSFWNTQNDYNSPQQQMQRLRESGLNANLVYGNGSAVNTAGDIKSPAAPSISPRSEERGNIVNGAVNSYFDAQSRALQLDNMKAQNTVLAEEAALKHSQKASTDANTFLTTGLTPYQLEARQLGNSKLKQETDYIWSNTVNNSQKNLYNQQKFGLEMDNLNLNNDRLRQGLRNAKESEKSVQLQNELRRLDLRLQKYGISRNSPLYERATGLILNKLGINF